MTRCPAQGIRNCGVPTHRVVFFQVMNTSAAAASVDRHALYNKKRLFLVSILALFTAGVAASLRASVATDLQRIFFDPIDKAHSAEMIGSVLGVAFLGFAFTIAIGSPLLDSIGMAFMLPLLLSTATSAPWTPESSSRLTRTCKFGPTERTFT